MVEQIAGDGVKTTYYVFANISIVTALDRYIYINAFFVHRKRLVIFEP